MEGEKILMAAGVTAAVVVGAFVFWGPSGLYSYIIGTVHRTPKCKWNNLKTWVNGNGE